MLNVVAEELARILGPGLRALGGVMVSRPMVDPDHVETASSRAGREFHVLVTSTVRFALWGALWAIGGGAVGLWLSWGHGRTGAVLITTCAAVVGVGCAFAVPFLWLWVTAPVVQRSELRSHAEAERGSWALALRKRTHQNDENEQAWREAAERKNAETESLRGQLGDALLRIADLETQRSAPGAADRAEEVLRADLVLLSDELDAACNTILTAFNDGPYWTEGIRVNVWEAIKDKHSGVRGFHVPRAAVRDAYEAIAYAETLRMHHEIDRQVGTPRTMFTMGENDAFELRRVLDRVLAGGNALTEFLDGLAMPEL